MMKISTFAKRLKEIRVNKSFTQEDISQIINISRSTYSNYETGFREPNIDTIVKIADTFDVNVDWLFGRTNVKEPYTKNE